MISFLDTSILVAAFFDDNPKHEACLKLFHSLSPVTGCCSNHSFFEVYCALTRMPKHNVQPAAALDFVTHIKNRLSPIFLTPDESLDLLRENSNRGIRGGTIYDAYLAGCALKAKASILYTFNVKHFSQFGPEVIRILRTPDQLPA